MMNRSRDRNFFPVTAADIIRYRGIGRGLTCFERECLLLGLDPAQFREIRAEYHEPMNFIDNGNEKVLPPRRKISGANVDE